MRLDRVLPGLFLAMLELHPARSDKEEKHLKFKIYCEMMRDGMRAAKNSRIDKWAENPPI